jgi:hypothetical protein
MKLEAQRQVPDSPNEVCLLFLGDETDTVDQIIINVDKESLLKIIKEIK